MQMMREPMIHRDNLPLPPFPLPGFLDEVSDRPVTEEMMQDDGQLVMQR